MLDKKLCFNLQFSHRSYVKKPMEKKSEKSIEALASSLFIEKSDGRAQLEYPFLFICCIVGLLVRICLNCRGNKNA